MTTAAVNDAVENPEGPNLGALPIWDLTDLYAGNDSPELEADLDRAEREACT